MQGATLAFKKDAQERSLERRPRRMNRGKRKEGPEGSSDHSRKKVAGQHEEKPKTEERRGPSWP